MSRQLHRVFPAADAPRKGPAARCVTKRVTKRVTRRMPRFVGAAMIGGLVGLSAGNAWSRVQAPQGGEQAPQASEDEPKARGDEPKGNVDEPFGDLLRGLQPAGDRPPETPSAAGAARPESGMEAKATAEVSPLVSARQAMGDAARLLSDARWGEARQAAQQQALDALDQFLQEAISAAGQPSSGEAAPQSSPREPTAGSQSANGAQQGTSAGDGEPAKGEGPPSSEGSGDGPGQQPGMAPRGDDAAPAKLSPETLEKAVWGHLPARLRERLQATLPEEFLPAYDRAIRDYFTRLSEMAEGDER